MKTKASLFHFQNPMQHLVMISPTDRELQTLFGSEFNTEYKLVAELDSSDLEEIFDLTNHVTKPWPTNEGVEMKTEAPVRSTSVGDVVRLPDMTYHLCLSIGWRDVTDFLKDKVQNENGEG